MISEISQTQKDKLYDSTYMRYLNIPIQTESRMVLVGWKAFFLMDIEFQFKIMKKPEDV